jgi:subtilisin family serine protease
VVAAALSGLLAAGIIVAPVASALPAAGGAPPTSSTTVPPSPTTTVAPPTTSTSTTTTTLPPPPPAAPNDPLFASQWGLGMIGAPAAWATSAGAGVTVGIVDTGVDLSHQDLAANVEASTDCVGSGGDPSLCQGTGQDDNGHGTHVAGIIAAVTNNGLGVAGTAPDAQLVVAKALTATGNGSLADINAGIEWVVNHGAKVVDLSLGDPTFAFSSTFGVTLQQGIEYAWSKGAIPVLSAGNGQALGLGTYGDLDAVVVGAVGHARTVPAYSSPTENAQWAVLAPGGSDDGVQGDDILSTYWVNGNENQYGYLAGTGMAAAFTSGTLALLVGEGLSPQAAVDELLTTADSTVACGPRSTTCRGLIDAQAAVAGVASPAGAGSAAGPSPSALPPTTRLPASSSVPAFVSPSTTTPVTAPVTSPPQAQSKPPSTVQAAPPAVMVPTRPGVKRAPPPPVTAAAKPPPSASTTTTTVAGTGQLAVGLATTSGKAKGSGSLAWFVVLAGVFALLMGGGIFRVMRTASAEGVD